MPDTTTAEHLFQLGRFTLNSGEQSVYKIECDALTVDDWDTLAWLATERLAPFSTVEGVPRGGLPFAAALAAHTWGHGGLLIVDDVWTTGGSMERHRDGREANGAVVFARSDVAGWVTPIFQLTPA